MIQRLLSRKLWLAVGSFVTFVANGAYPEAMGIVLAYIGVQGYADAKVAPLSAYSAKEIPESQNVDTSQFVSGTGRVKPNDQLE